MLASFVNMPGKCFRERGERVNPLFHTTGSFPIRTNALRSAFLGTSSPFSP